MESRLNGMRREAGTRAAAGSTRGVFEAMLELITVETSPCHWGKAHVVSCVKSSCAGVRPAPARPVARPGPLAARRRGNAGSASRPAKVPGVKLLPGSLLGSREEARQSGGPLARSCR